MTSSDNKTLNCSFLRYIIPRNTVLRLLTDHKDDTKSIFTKRIEMKQAQF